jgi:starch synthase
LRCGIWDRSHLALSDLCHIELASLTPYASVDCVLLDRQRPEGRGLVSNIKALFVTSEFASLVKAGGLREVSAALPLALQRRGVDMRILMPAYQDIVAKLPLVNWFGDLPGRAGIPRARIGEARLPDGMILYLVASPSLFDRRGTPYCTPEGADWEDNHLRFARLSFAAAEIAAGRGGLDWTPDVVHANDWPGA